MESAKGDPVVAPPSVEEEPNRKTVSSSPPSSPSVPVSTAPTSSVLVTHSQSPGDLSEILMFLNYLSGFCRVKIW